MQRATPIAAAIAALVLMLAAPAWAGYGAIAYDEYSGKQGASWDQPQPARANELALRECASAKCMVHPIEPHECGALALSDKDKAWGGADHLTLEAAKREPMSRCRTPTTHR